MILSLPSHDCSHRSGPSRSLTHLLHALFLRAWLVLACLILGVMSGAVSWAGPASDHPSAKSFQVGEQLTYEISWLNITAGTAVMAVSAAGTDGERPLVKLVTTAQSRPAITKFFPVDNRVESIVDPATLLPEHMTFKRREGKKKEDIEYTFHQKEGTVTASKVGRRKRCRSHLAPKTSFPVSIMRAASYRYSQGLL